MKKIIYILLMGTFLGCSQIDNFKLKTKKEKEVDYNLAIINTGKGQGVLNEGIGYSRVSTIIKRAEDRYGKKNVLYLDVGGNFSGTKLANKTKGSSSVTVFNGIKLKATTLGEEDFKYGLDNLEQIKEKSNFKLIATNIKKIDGSTFLDNYLIEKIGNNKIGIIGLVSPKFYEKLEGREIEKISIEEPISSAKTTIKSFKKQGVDFIIVLSSLGNDEKINKEWTIKKLAEETNGIDLIIDKGENNDNSFKIKNTLIVSSREKLKSLGIIQIDLNARKTNKNRMNYRVLKAEEIYKNDLPELKIEQYLVKKEDTLYSLAKKYKTTVGELLKLNPEIKDGQTIKINQKYLVPILNEKFDERIQENKKNKTKQIKIIEDRQIKKIIEKIN